MVEDFETRDHGVTRGTRKTMKILAFLFLCLFGTASNSAAFEGLASWYSSASVVREGTCKASRCYTASGKEIYDLEKKKIMFCAFPEHMGKLLRVVNRKTGKSVIVRVLDRGGFARHGRAVDLCKDAFARIADTKQGIIKVKIERA